MKDQPPKHALLRDAADGVLTADQRRCLDDFMAVKKEQQNWAMQQEVLKLFRK